jgi:purine nucleosidase
MEKILLDTDIGTNIDDALCLAYLLANPECTLAGVTTVTGEAGRRAMIASALIRAAGKDIPVLPGAEEPLLIEGRQRTAPQAALLDRWDHQEQFPKGEALEFMRQTINEWPGEVTLLTIGPLTNVALLFAADSSIPSKLKRLVSMCGRYAGEVPAPYGPVERNVALDPHAAAIVYGARVGLHRCVGLEVSTRVRMNAKTFRQAFASRRRFTLLSEIGEAWLREREEVIFHDPLAAATIFDETVCCFETGTVTVELADGEERGMTRWAPRTAGSRQEVATNVAAEKFFAHYRSVLGLEPRPLMDAG